MKDDALTGEDPALVPDISLPFCSTVWLFRPASARISRQAIALGILAPDFNLRQDLRDHFDHGMIEAELEQANPGLTPGKLRSLSDQLKLLLHDLPDGQMIVMPVKETGELLIGSLVNGVVQDADGYPARRVTWAVRIPLLSVREDLRHSMGTALQVAEIKRNRAAERFSAMAAGRADPGPEGTLSDDLPDRDVIEKIMFNRLRLKLGTLFAGHGLAALTGALLELDGYRVDIAPPGPDGGIDILAGKGMVGLGDGLVVQVKSGDIVSNMAVYHQLKGVMQETGARHGLLVSWAGVRGDVRSTLKREQFMVRLWDGADVTRMVLAHYQDLPRTMREAIGLKPIQAL